MREWMIVVLRTAALVYAGLMLVLVGCQRSMIYYPARSTEAAAARLAALEGLAPWRDAAGDLIGWRPAEGAADRDALLIFHGNAGFAAHRGYFLRGFGPYFAVHVLEYPGYGARRGAPSEASLAEAARAALRQLQTESAGRIFVGGESLGSGVACRLAGEHPDVVAGLFLATPFSSLVDVARSHYPFLPVRWLLRDRYESAAHLAAYRGPVAILLAEQDEVIPARLGRKLYEGYTGPKRLWVQAGRSHNTLDYSPGHPFWREVAEFLRDSPAGATSSE